MNWTFYVKLKDLSVYSDSFLLRIIVKLRLNAQQ